jgi:hypothetical protein
MSRSHLALTTVVVAAAVAAAAVPGCGSPGDLPGGAVRTAAAAQVSSSIAEGAELTDPVRWQARVTGVPAGGVVSVRFLIDGNLKHLEREAPYLFAGRGNLLLPGTLGPGSHVFAVDVTLADGHRLTTASTAVVSKQAPGIPRQALGTWTRTVTAAEVAHTQSFRNPADGAPLPTGTWHVAIGTDGVARYTDPTAAHDLTAGQVRFEPGGRLVVGNEIPNVPHASKGGFCGDAVGAGIYRWSRHGRVLVIRAVNDHQCADRNSFWNGIFTRSDQPAKTTNAAARQVRTGQENEAGTPQRIVITMLTFGLSGHDVSGSRREQRGRT